MSRIGIGLVHAYRRTLGALFPTTCKFHPTCSQYAIDAFREYGLLRGAVLTADRLRRCHPWSHGGVDHVREQHLLRGRLARPRGGRA